MTLPLFTYRAEVVRVIDGDTIDFDVDLGFHDHQGIRTRLLGINAPEMSTLAGKAARQFVVDQFMACGAVVAVVLGSPAGPPPILLEIETFKDAGDKYGRWLARVHLPGGVVLNDLMVSSGHAVVMPQSTGATGANP